MGDTGNTTSSSNVSAKASTGAYVVGGEGNTSSIGTANGIDDNSNSGKSDTSDWIIE
jgi:hypothetical protein